MKEGNFKRKMKSTNVYSKTVKCLFVLITVVLFSSGVTLGDDKKALDPIVAAKKAADKPTEKSGERFVSIDFNNVDITVFIKFISLHISFNFLFRLLY